jgi:predicted acylesterase/phospholipase RssA
MVAPKYLVIGPGAMGFFCFMGQLSRMDLTRVEAVSGSSAGAILALLWVVCEGNIPEMLDLALSVPISKLMKPNIKNFVSNFGLVPLGRIRHAFSKIFLKKFKISDLTFEDLRRRRPVTVYMSAFCSDTGQTIYFSHETHPNQSILDVVCASIAVPFLFSTMKIGEWRYIDGGFQESTPALPFVGKPRHEVTIIQLSPSRIAPCTTFAGYMVNIFTFFLRLRHVYDFPTYLIDTENIDIFDFGSDGLQLFVHGQKSRKLINEAHHPLGVHDAPQIQDDPRQRYADPQVVHVPPQGGLDPRQTRANPGRGCGRQGSETDRQIEEGYVDPVRIPSSGGHDQPSQGAEQGDKQGW